VPEDRRPDEYAGKQLAENRGHAETGGEPTQTQGQRQQHPYLKEKQQ